MSDHTAQGFATRAIHSGYDPATAEGALTPPIHTTSTYVFSDVAQGAARFAGTEPGHVYSRISNPTVELLEKRMADLEGAAAGLATASGMGAISALMWTLLRPGDELITDQTLYGCTHAFFHHGLSEFGIRVRSIDMTRPEELAEALSEQTRLVYFETPANPNMRLIDIPQVASIAHQSGARVVVDNTYATPLLTRPIALGADFVVHSATKYLGGHGDLVGGLLLGTQEDLDQVRMKGLKDFTGAVMSPFTAFLIMRGLKTLEVRVRRQSETALALAHWLASHPSVECVHYPGLPEFPQHELARRQMTAFTGLIAFELKGGMPAGIDLMDRLQLIQRAVSLGDTESLIQHPASMTHSVLTPEERARHGVSDALVRFSVGLETPEDLQADLAQGLEPIE